MGKVNDGNYTVPTHKIGNLGKGCISAVFGGLKFPNLDDLGTECKNGLSWLGQRSIRE